MGRRQSHILVVNFAFWPAIYFVWSLLRFLPNSSGRLGHDYGAYIPWLISGLFWRMTNGATSVPEFVPSFCAGVPLVFNPQSIYFSLPGLLVTLLPPVPSFAASWIAFGLIGGLSTFGLLRRVFRTSSEAATVGGVLFMLNGFFMFRMVIGHVTFHPFMLVPAMVWALIQTPRTSEHHPSLRLDTATRSVVFAALLAYSFYSGGVYVLTTVPLILVSLLIVAYLMDRCDRQALTILVFGGSLAIALCAYRLFPAMAYSANVPRLNEMLLFDHLPSLVAGAFATLFVPQVLKFIDGSQAHGLMRHELEYGVGLAPLLLLLGGAYHALGRRLALQTIRRLPSHKVIAACALLAVLLSPILITYSGFGVRWMLVHTPVIKSMSVMLRFWSVYIPILCIVPAVALDRFVVNPQRRLVWSAAAIALTVVQAASTDVGYYQSQIYDPSSMNIAYRQMHDGEDLPAIDRIERPSSPDNFFWNEGFVTGATTLPCYEPMFGYQGENFPTRRTEIGPVMRSSHGVLNLKNPACYVFPGANDCHPGDEFTDAQEASAEAFIHYKPFPYRWPLWEYAATALTLVSASISVIIAAVGLFHWIRRRPAIED